MAPATAGPTDGAWNWDWRGYFFVVLIGFQASLPGGCVCESTSRMLDATDAALAPRMKMKKNIWPSCTTYASCGCEEGR